MFSPAFFAAVATLAVTVIAATEAMKRTLKLGGLGPVLFTIIASFAVSVPGLSQGIIYYIVLSACTALAANYLFKAVHTPKHK